MLGYLSIGLIILCFVIILLIYARKRKQKNKRAALQDSWGKAHSKNRQLERIAVLYELAPPDFAAINHLDEETCNDIDFASLFDLVDHTTSKVGQQYLYAQLLSTTGSIDLIKERASLMDWVTEHPAERLELQMAISKLDARQIYNVPLLFAESLPFNKNMSIASEILKWLAIFFTIGAFFDLRFILGVVALFFINLVVHYLNKKHIQEHLSAFIQVSKLISAAEKINTFQTPLVDHPILTNALNGLKKLKQNLGLISVDTFGQGYNETTAMIWILGEYLKIMFLIEVNSYYKSIKELTDKKEDLYKIYCALGKADATIAMASFKATLPYSSTPQMIAADEDTVIEIEDAFHPLIPDCVANSIRIPKGRGTLISGSNMSGKTSFIRTVGINILFAQTLSICLAKKCQIPPLRLSSSIRISDDVEEGKSYYIQEVERIYNFLEAANDHHGNFFLLDEIFKGTNTLERVAAASAVLSHLNDGNSYVMVATHDIELIDLLKDGFDPYYFSEEIQNSESIYFDHKIKKGVLQEGNAIKLLDFFQFPKSVVKEALLQKGKMLKNKTLF